MSCYQTVNECEPHWGLLRLLCPGKTELCFWPPAITLHHWTFSFDSSAVYKEPVGPAHIYFSHGSQLNPALRFLNPVFPLTTSWGNLSNCWCNAAEWIWLTELCLNKIILIFITEIQLNLAQTVWKFISLLNGSTFVRSMYWITEIWVKVITKG